MKVKEPPRAYRDWRRDPNDRTEDAAYTFGYHLIMECRDAAVATLPDNASPKLKAAVNEAVDIALHSVVTMIEGIYPLKAGSKHSITLALGVQVHDSRGRIVETIEISPEKLDLQIGYWKWAQDRSFRSKSALRPAIAKAKGRKRRRPHLRS